MVKNDICLGDKQTKCPFFKISAQKYLQCLKSALESLLISETEFWSIRIDFILPPSLLNLGISFDYGKVSSKSSSFKLRFLPWKKALNS